MGEFAAAECRSCVEAEDLVAAALAPSIGSPRLPELVRNCRAWGSRSVLIVVHIAPPPLSLEKLRYDEWAGKAPYHSIYNPYLGENLKVWAAGTSSPSLHSFIAH